MASILAMQVSNFIVTNEIHIRHHFMTFIDTILYIFGVPFFFYGWLYGLLMGILVYFSKKIFDKWEKNNNEKSQESKMI